MLALFKTLWRGWRRFGHKLIKAQNWFLMAMVYWTTLAPTAILLRLSGKKLLDRELGPPDAGSFWVERKDGPYTMEKSQHMS